MSEKSPDMTALIASRICHDLANPLGAIANGMELLELTGLADTPEAALLSDSIASATARIEFFRIAFGPANADALISPAVAQRRLTQNYDETKTDVHWQIPTDCPRPIAKLLFLLTQAAGTALPFGGAISISQSSAVWAVVATGREIRTHPELWDHLTAANPSEPLQSAQIHFALARQQARDLDKGITVQSSEGSLTVSVT